MGSALIEVLQSHHIFMFDPTHRDRDRDRERERERERDADTQTEREILYNHPLHTVDQLSSHEDITDILYIE